MATREEYMKKYGPVTRGLKKQKEKDNAEQILNGARAAYERNDPIMATAQEYSSMASMPKPKYQSAYLADTNKIHAPSGQFKEIREAEDYASMIQAGQNKPNYFNPSINKPWENLKYTKYGDYNFTYMSDQEKDDYLYLVGKYGYDTANNYMKEIADDLNARSQEIAGRGVREKSAENPAAGIIGNLAGSLVSGTGYMGDLADAVRRKEYNPYSIGHGASVMENASREGVKEWAREHVWDSAGMDFLTDTGLSIGQSTMRMPMGKAGTAFAGMGAATQGVEDALERGASRNRALALGGAYGTAEAAFEQFSVGGLQALKENPVYAMKDIRRNLAKQMVTEGSEEMFTEAANAITDRLIMGDQSNFEIAKNAYLQQGLSDKEAERKALQDVAKNIALAGAGGALSGGIMGGGAMALGAYEQGRIGKNSGIQQYQEFADSIDTDMGTYTEKEDYDRAVNLQQLAQEYADRQQKGEELSSLEKGAFERDLYEFERSLVDGAQIQQDNDVHEKVQTAKRENRQQEPQEQKGNVEPQLSYNDIAEFGNSLGRKGQAAFVSNYDGTVAMGDYQTAFGRYYDAGRYNAEMETADKAAIAAVLTPEQVTAAYKAGAQDRYASLGRTYTQGDLKMGSARDLSGRASKDQMNVASNIGTKTGLHFELVNKEDGVSGSYQPEKGIVQIAVDSDNFLQTTSHELTHFIKDYAPVNYETYKQMAVQALMNSESMSYDDLVKRYENAYEQTGTTASRDEVLDEIVADATGRFLNDETFVSDVTREDRGIAQKILDFISDMIDSVKRLISEKGIRKAAEGLYEDLDFYENARDLWAQALEVAGETYKSGKEISVEKTGKKKYALSKPELVSEKNIEANYDVVRNMEPVTELRGDEFAKGDKNLREQVGEYYASFGNVVHNDVVGDIRIDNRSIKDDIAHGVGRLKAITFKAVPQVIEKGHVLYFAKNWKMRGYDSAVIGAPIKILSGVYAGNYYEACVVRIDHENRMYVHEVHTTKMEDTSAFKTGADKTGGLPGADNLPSIYSIFNKLINVKETGTDDGKFTGNMDDEVEEARNIDGIRFQLDGVDQDMDIESLIQENEQLRAVTSSLEQQLQLTKDYQPRMDDINRVAGKILSEYNSSYSKEKLVNNLSKLYNYIRSSDRVDGREVTEAATAIGRSILNQAKQADTELTDQYRNVISHIRGIKMVLPEAYRSEMDSVGGYQNFRKQNFGKLRLGNSGIDVDTAYQELTDLYPELFSRDIINPIDELLEIAKVMDNLQPQIVNPYHANIDEMSYLVGQQIFDAYFDVRNLPPTKADRMAAEVYRTKREYTKRMTDYKEKLKQDYDKSLKEIRKESIKEIQELASRYEKASKEEKAELRKRMDDLRSYKNQALRAQQDRYQKSLQMRRERLEASQYKKQIIKDVLDMKNWLVNPTDKKHVPEDMRVKLAEFLGGIDFSSERTNAEGDPVKRTVQWVALKDICQKIALSGQGTEKEGMDIYMEIDPDMVDRMGELTNKIKDIDRLDNLDVKTLRELRTVVQAMKHSIQDANRMLSNKNYERVQDIAQDFLYDSSRRRDKVEFQDWMGTIESMAQSDMLDAYTFFNRMGPAAETVYQELRDGLDKKIRNTKLAQDYMSDLFAQYQVSQSDIRAWSGKKAVIHEFKIMGNTLKLTEAQIMSLYVLNKRKQAQGHIYSKMGGIKPAPRIKKVKGVVEVLDKAIKPVVVEPLDVDQILSVLSEKQKGVADGIVKFFTTQTSSWGNEVSMQLYGYKKFNAKNYFPIVVDGNYIKTLESEIGATMTTLKNMGATKATVYKASNPIIIEDIFDVYTRQADQMGSYNAFVVPLSDLQKFYNFKHKGISVKEEIDRTFGKDAKDYIHQLMIDVNGTESKERDISHELMRQMKTASVGANLRTVIQQPTAYVRAMAEMNTKYLIQGLSIPFVSAEEWELAKKYAPIAQWKDWGYFDINTGRSMKNIFMGPENLKEKVVEKSMWLAGKGDELAWKRLWEAAKAETKDLHKELKPGSEEFYQQAGKRMSEIIDRTQVVDTVLHRTKLMKQKKGIAPMYTSFMSEPAKTYNMLYRAIGDAIVKRNAEARRGLGRILLVYVLNAAATSLVASIVDAMRDDDDEELTKKYLDALTENLKDNINPLNIIPILRDLVSISKGFTVQRTDMQGFLYISYDFGRIKKMISGESEWTIPGLIFSCSKGLSYLFGIPVSNATRDLKGLVSTMIDVFAGRDVKYGEIKFFRNIESKKNTKRYVGFAMRSYAEGDKKNGDQIIRELRENGIEEKSIKKAYKDVLKEDIRVKEAAAARLEGNAKLYEEIVGELEEEGYIRDYIIGAIASVAEKNTDDDMYGYADIMQIYLKDKGAKNGMDNFKIASETFMKEKKKGGMEEEEVLKQIRSKFKEEYLDRYVNGTDKEREDIRKELYSIRIDGKKLFDSEEYFKNWMKK